MRGSDHDGDSPLRSVLAAAAHRVRHPAAPLAHFVADADQLPEDFDGDGDGCEDLDLPPAALEEARQRRAALVVAATGIIDRSIDDLRELDFGDDGLPDPDQAEESFVFERFPARHRAGYDEVFFRNVLVTVVKVAHDLADPHGEPAACTAEEIVRDAVIDEALGLLPKPPEGTLRAAGESTLTNLIAGQRARTRWGLVGDRSLMVGC